MYLLSDSSSEFTARTLDYPRRRSATSRAVSSVWMSSIVNDGIVDTPIDCITNRTHIVPVMNVAGIIIRTVEIVIIIMIAVVAI